MKAFIKALVAFLTGGAALYWRPAMETTQYSFTSALDMSGQVVTFVWLFFAFLWAFAGTMVGYSAACAVFSYLGVHFRGNGAELSGREAGP